MPWLASPSAAHDFNNVLSVILNYSEFLVQLLGQPELIPEELAEARRDLEQVKVAAERRVALTLQLRALHDPG